MPAPVLFGDSVCGALFRTALLTCQVEVCAVQGHSSLLKPLIQLQLTAAQLSISLLILLLEGWEKFGETTGEKR